MKSVKTFLFIIFTLLILSSCGANENALLDLERDIAQPQNFSFETERTEYGNDVKAISYLITDTSNEEVTFATEAFELQYKTDDGWKIVAFKKDTEFNELATVLKPGESAKGEIQLEKYYNLPLSSGEYRIVKELYASNVFKVN